ncbi:MAG: UDP-N-acetylmuramate dehydrogenase [Treponema sp.]|jgi:UDP-N-acetylmuramate dehydrogenase|nr:UDP-N-acetylmuramate dehydrogenase [Treponema sp.]
MDNIREIIAQCQEKNPCAVDVRFDEPMSGHTTFKVGGPADCWLQPREEGFPAFSAALLSSARAAGVSVFILGGGANIVVSDKGIRGIVLDTSAWKGSAAIKKGLSFRSGTSLDEAAESAACAGLSGLEFLAGMPGTIGGAVFMNARCYGREISDVLTSVEIIDYGVDGTPAQKRVAAGEGFDYKRSPFQGKEQLILSADFALNPADVNDIRQEMEENRHDRQTRGHYLFPCAGSAFKNNHDFGKPTGRIIDELGLRGLQSGGAQIAPFHGNIIINTGGATAADIRALMNEVSSKVKAATGFVPEPEILFVGE